MEKSEIVELIAIGAYAVLLIGGALWLALTIGNAPGPGDGVRNGYGSDNMVHSQQWLR